MKIYYRDLTEWHKAGQVGYVADYEHKLCEWCKKHLGERSMEVWGTFRANRSSRYTRPEGIYFAKDEYATAFLLVHK